MAKYLVICIFSLYFGSYTAFCEAELKHQKPNIILILSDDAGYADFSFQSNRLISTPNIDNIANQGVKFSDAYVTGAVCSPSRAGMLTGINQAKFGQIYNFVKNVKYNLPLDSVGIPVDQKLIGDYLKPMGYTTGIVGKWHEGFAERFHPNNRGFDYFWGFLWGSSPYLSGQATLVQENAKSIAPKEIPYMTDAIGNQALKFIDEQATKPFFLYVSFNAPHTPMQAKPELLEKYKGKFDSNGRALNAAMTESMDENVGRILAKLEELRLTENTLIVFTNDNGGQTVQSFADNYPLRGRKGEVYEGGIRVPMAMKWPGKVKAGTISNIPVSTLDFLPTFINAAGDRASRYPGLEGNDLIKLLNYRKSSRLSERTFYWDIGYGNAAIRQGKWKMTFLRGKSPELFDLGNDISESVNVYAQYPEIGKKLNKKFDRWKSLLPAPVWIPIGKSDDAEDN